MTTVARLTAEIGVNSSNFEKGVARVKARMLETERAANTFGNRFKRGFDQAGNSISGVVGKFNALRFAVAGLVTGGVAALVKQQIDMVSALKDTSTRLQISTDDLQVYQFAAKQAGISNEDLENALGKLNAKIADGSLKYKSLASGLGAIAAAVKNAKTEQERLAIVNEQFGDKIGRKILPLLLGGREGLTDFATSAREAGAIISADFIEKTDKMGDSLDALIFTMSKKFSTGFLDQLVGSTGQFSDLMKDKSFMDGIENFGTLLGGIANIAFRAASGVGYVVGKIVELGGAIKGIAVQENVDAFNRLSKKGDKRAANFAGSVFTQAKMKAEEERKAMQEAYAKLPKPKESGEALQKPGSSDDDRAKKIKAVLDGLDQEKVKLEAQIAAQGRSAEAANTTIKRYEIMNKLTADGIKLTQKQRAEIEAKLALNERDAEILKNLERQQKFAEGFTDTIRKGFEDAIIEGGKLKDVFSSVIKEIEKMLLKRAVMEPLFGASGTGGLIGGLFTDLGRGLFSSFPSYATGTSMVPYDMTARLHKGEAVVPAQQARGMGGVMVNITNNAGVDVKAQHKQTVNGDSLEIMIDKAVAKNISSKGSATNQALGNATSQSLIRR